jgi:thiosulfate dehydrogenase
MTKSKVSVGVLISFVFSFSLVLLFGCKHNISTTAKTAIAWKAPDTSAIPVGKAGDMIRYGRELLTNTAKYFGPQGTVAQISNGMNCQNCHLDGGRKLFGNNYAVFTASYPRLSFRSGKITPASARISECFERSLNGRSPDTSGKEVRAMLTYMQWLGKGVKKGQKLYGGGSEKLTFMTRSADRVTGRIVFIAKCQSCHGPNGDGQLSADKKTYVYPPVWGEHSYNDGAGMYRIINLAGFVKNNMPFGASYPSSLMSDQEAWDVAAFINSQPRPHRDQHADWPDLKNKPVDFPFGPYADGFSEKQHKFGPFKPINSAKQYN